MFTVEIKREKVKNLTHFKDADDAKLFFLLMGGFKGSTNVLLKDEKGKILNVL